MTDRFISSALGEPNEYRNWVTDGIWLVMAARMPIQDGGAKLYCRPIGSNDPYSDVWHNQAQIMIVLADFNALT